MPCPLEANPLDTISKCCSKIMASHMAGVLRKSLTDRKAGSSLIWGKGLSSKLAEGLLARKTDK